MKHGHMQLQKKSSLTSVYFRVSTLNTEFLWLMVHQVITGMNISQQMNFVSFYNFDVILDS